MKNGKGNEVKVCNNPPCPFIPGFLSMSRTRNGKSKGQKFSKGSHQRLMRAADKARKRVSAMNPAERAALEARARKIVHGELDKSSERVGRMSSGEKSRLENHARGISANRSSRGVKGNQIEVTFHFIVTYFGDY